MDAIYKSLLTLGFEKAAIIVLLLGVFIDINPGIKLNPIKTLFRYIGKAFNSSVQNDIKGLKEDMGKRMDQLQDEQVAQRLVLNKLISENSETEMNKIKWDIIDFAADIVNEGKHSRSQYRHILASFEEYERIISELGNTADDDYLQVKEAGKRIRAHYDKFEDTNFEYF